MKFSKLIKTILLIFIILTDNGIRTFETNTKIKRVESKRNKKFKTGLTTGNKKATTKEPFTIILVTLLVTGLINFLTNKGYNYAEAKQMQSLAISTEQSTEKMKQIALLAKKVEQVECSQFKQLLATDKIIVTSTFFDNLYLFFNILKSTPEDSSPSKCDIKDTAKETTEEIVTHQLEKLYFNIELIKSSIKANKKIEELEQIDMTHCNALDPKEYSTRTAEMADVLIDQNSVLADISCSSAEAVINNQQILEKKNNANLEKIEKYIKDNQDNLTFYLLDKIFDKNVSEKYEVQFNWKDVYSLYKDVKKVVGIVNKSNDKAKSATEIDDLSKQWEPKDFLKFTQSSLLGWSDNLDDIYKIYKQLTTKKKKKKKKKK